jgi:hypothetical protein
VLCSGAVGADNDLGASGDDETGDGFILQVITRVFLQCIVVQVVILECGGVFRADDDYDAGDDYVYRL